MLRYWFGKGRSVIILSVCVMGARNSNKWVPPHDGILRSKDEERKKNLIYDVPTNTDRFWYMGSERSCAHKMATQNANFTRNIRWNLNARNTHVAKGRGSQETKNQFPVKPFKLKFNKFLFRSRYFKSVWI